MKNLQVIMQCLIFRLSFNQTNLMAFHLIILIALINLHIGKVLSFGDLLANFSPKLASFSPKLASFSPKLASISPKLASI